jgi:Mrp family chromosome partitioning ATPase
MSAEVAQRQVAERIVAAPDPARSTRNFDAWVRDYYRGLLRRLDWPYGDSSRSLRTLGVTSCYGEEGVSTVAAHLAATAAALGNYRVLLVDANLMRPAVHEIYGMQREPGLADFLSDDGQLSTALHVARVASAFAVDEDQLIEALQPSPVANLSILAAGKTLNNPAWAYESGDVPGLIEILENRFDLVVFDMPAIVTAGSATRLAAALDGVLLVVEADRVASAVARHVRGVLADASAHLLGAVLNKSRGVQPPLI